MREICVIEEDIPTLKSLENIFLLTVIGHTVKTEKQYSFYFSNNTA